MEFRRVLVRSLLVPEILELLDRFARHERGRTVDEQAYADHPLVLAEREERIAELLVLRDAIGMLVVLEQPRHADDLVAGRNRGDELARHKHGKTGRQQCRERGCQYE